MKSPPQILTLLILIALVIYRASSSSQTGKIIYDWSNAASHTRKLVIDFLQEDGTSATANSISDFIARGRAGVVVEGAHLVLSGHAVSVAGHGPSENPSFDFGQLVSVLIWAKRVLLGV